VRSVEQLDDALAERAARGESDAFGLIYDRYAKRVASLLRSFAEDRSHLEDLVHDTFCRAMDGLSAYQPRGKFRSWLFSIALNVGRKDARRRARIVDISSAEPLLAPAADRADTPTLARERARLVEALVHSLPQPERLVVVLRIWLELGYDEIASLLEVPSGTARRRMHTALKRLRDCVEHTSEVNVDDLPQEPSHGRPAARRG
jgi:RNA polymerase sigma-70 factor (ECF subfamily)